MKKILALALTVALVLTSTFALAAGKLEKKQENFWVIPGFWNYAYGYAKVENVGDKPVNVNAGVLEVYDENGNVITSTDYMTTSAKTLQPGEYTYVAMNSQIEESSDYGTPDDFMVTVTGKTDNSSTTLRLPVETKLSLQESNGWWNEDYMYVTITNNTEEIQYNVTTIMALLDADGNILCVDTDSLYNSHGIGPGSTITVRKEISSSFTDYFKANNITPASVDAIASVDK